MYHYHNKKKQLFSCFFLALFSYFFAVNIYPPLICRQLATNIRVRFTFTSTLNFFFSKIFFFQFVAYV